MDDIRGPLFKGPLFPVGNHEKAAAPPQRLKGTIVGIRAGRSGDAGATQILTIKLAEADADCHKLLDTDIEILVPLNSMK